MKKIKIIILTLVCFLITPLSVMAQVFDGSKPLYCAIADFGLLISD